MSKILDKISKWFLYGNFIFLYQVVSFGIYAIPGYSNTVSDFGIVKTLRTSLIFSIIYYVSVFIVDYYLKSLKFEYADSMKQWVISKFKAFPKELGLIAIIIGYLLYSQYCSNFYAYITPLFITLILIIIKKIKLKLISAN